MAKTPKPVLDAIFPKEIKIGDIKLQEFSLLHYLALEQIDSPLLKSPEDGATVSARDVARALLVLSLPPLTAREFLSQGLSHFDDIVAEFAARIPGRVMVEAIGLIVRHIEEAFATVLPQPAGEPDDPLPPSQPDAAASAGS